MRFSRASAIKSAISSISSSFIPRVVTAGVPTADTAGFENRIGVERDRVFVHGDSGAIEHFLRFFPVQIFRAKIDKHQMIVGAAGNDAVTVFGQTGCESFGVGHDLPLIIAELRLKRFVKTNRFGRDHVHERAALDARENRRVDLLWRIVPGTSRSRRAVRANSCAWWW